MTEHLDAQKAWTQQELDEIKSFNLRMDQRITAIAEATLEAKSIATAARIRAEDDDSALTLDMEERVESIEERMACQSQEITHAIDYHPQFIDLDEKISNLESHMDGNFESLTDKTEGLEEELDSLKKKMEAFDQRMEAFDQRMEAFDKRIATLEGKIEGLTATVGSHRNFLHCREYEEIIVVGKYVPGQGYVVPEQHPSFVRDFLKLALDENVSKLIQLLAFYRTREFEYWEDAEDLDDSSDDDLVRHTTPPNLEAAAWRFRNTAMRVLASHLGLNYDEIMRLHQARVAAKQSKASKRQQKSSGDWQRQSPGKVQKRLEVPGTGSSEESQAASLPCHFIPHSAVPATSTTETASTPSRSKEQEVVKAEADDEA
ncbi:MAG: hypothetical protein M1815_003042 [Lichina confinis]|nr:MAG: hypothetical protein M1815_003042 [Lichina confinis]